VTFAARAPRSVDAGRTGAYHGAMARTAAALLIGNEILTGKIQEANLAYLGQELFKLGIALERAIVCRDDVEVIVSDLNALRATHDYVFTSGGVGPTHDDVTLPAIAQAFGRKLERAAAIEALIRAYHGERVTAEHLRMADVPEGARLIASDDVPWPTIAVDNVYVFPGVPEIFRLKFPVLRAQLHEGTGFVSRAVLTMCDEGEIALQLAEVARLYPELFVGSYPRLRDPNYRLKVTVDGADEARVARALSEIVAFLPPDKIVRVE
jgi:molybdopterin-biosynthesis enzyme MoeA-like protein